MRYTFSGVKTRFTLKRFHDIIIFINDGFVTSIEDFREFEADLSALALDLWRCRNDRKEKAADRNREF